MWNYLDVMIDINRITGMFGLLAEPFRNREVFSLYGTPVAYRSRGIENIRIAMGVDEERAYAIWRGLMQRDLRAAAETLMARYIIKKKIHNVFSSIPEIPGPSLVLSIHTTHVHLLYPAISTLFPGYAVIAGDRTCSQAQSRLYKLLCKTMVSVMEECFDFLDLATNSQNIKALVHNHWDKGDRVLTTLDVKTGRWCLPVRWGNTELLWPGGAVSWAIKQNIPIYGILCLCPSLTGPYQIKWIHLENTGDVHSTMLTFAEWAWNHIKETPETWWGWFFMHHCLK